MTSMTPWRDGLVVRDDGGHRWAWVVGYLALVVGETLGARYADGLWWLTLGAAVAFAGGAAWQATYRRDLADRLVLLSWLFVIGMLLALVPGVHLAESGAGGGVGFGGLLAGLVLTEQWLRQRDRRTAATDAVGTHH